MYRIYNFRDLSDSIFIVATVGNCKNGLIIMNVRRPKEGKNPVHGLRSSLVQAVTPKNDKRSDLKWKKYLQERGLQFSPVNKGALVVTFKPYTGEKPCYGEYYCSKCERRWE